MSSSCFHRDAAVRTGVDAEPAPVALLSHDTKTLAHEGARAEVADVHAGSAVVARGRVGALHRTALVADLRRVLEVAAAIVAAGW